MQTVCSPNSRDELPTDFSAGGTLAKELEKGLLLDCSANWAKRLNAVGIGAHQVLAMNEVETNPIYAKNGLIEIKELPTGGIEKRPGTGPWLSSMRPNISRQEVPFGSDCEAILGEVGLDGKMDQLELAGAIKRPT